MQNRFNLMLHANILDRMAAAQGLDLDESVMAGHLTPDELGDAVLACTGCAAPEACERWLTAHEVRDAIPSYCRNRAVLLELTARFAR